jgi:hypothetical protein
LRVPFPARQAGRGNVMRLLIAVLSFAALALSTGAEAYLVCSNPAGDNVTWYVGQPTPSLNVADGVSCAANGAELQYVRDKFTGIPMRAGTLGRTVIWRGEAAVFILDNL